MGNFLTEMTSSNKEIFQLEKTIQVNHYNLYQIRILLIVGIKFADIKKEKQQKRRNLSMPTNHKNLHL